VLGGLGIIFWIAANWGSLSRAGRFALLESFFGVLCIGALLLQNARIPLAVLALLTTGGLLAFFGQTYQSGADPWQLFAWWSALTFPLCVGARHDALWTAWCVVVMTGLTLWTHAQGGYVWTSGAVTSIYQIWQWSGALMLAIALSPPFRRYTGAGIWSLRLCLLLAATTISAGALENLLDSQTPGQYYLGLVCLIGLFVAFCVRALHDTFGLCVFGLGLNLLIVCGMARALMSSRADVVSAFLIIGLSAAALLGATVKGILALSRNRELQGSTQ
jgi:uncharacterized membrane protein